MKYIKKQKGFTLITVLMLSGAASILVINSLKDNINQERLSGNFQKSINSRLASEQGLFETMEIAQAFLNDSANSAATLADLKAHLESNTLKGISDFTHGNTTYDVTVDPSNTEELILSSKGNRFEGESVLKIRLKVVPGTAIATETSGFSTFTNAIVGCESVNLGGSGTIDSYNSNDGTYNSGSAGTNGDVKTIDESSGDVVLGGDSPILGDIIATGNIDIQSSDVTGNLHANGNVILGDGGSVSGNVLASGNYNQQSATVGGHVRVAGDFYMKYGGGATIENTLNDGLDFIYGGNFIGNSSVPNELQVSPYKDNGYEVAKVKNSDVTVEGYDATNPDTNCDHLDIVDIVDTVNVDVNNAILNNFRTHGASINYTIKPKGAAPQDGLFDSAFASWHEAVPTNVFISSELLGKDVDFLSFGDFQVRNGDKLTIDGDVTLFIDGDFTISNNAVVQINDNSSLTIVITGVFHMADKRVSDKTGNNVNAAQSLNIYSSYVSNSTYSQNDGKTSASDPGIIIDGSSDLYVTVYAPLADVNVLASGAVYGAIRGKTTNVSGDAAIHFDEALAENTQISTGSTTNTTTSTGSTLEFIGFEY